jgi:large subunit ribosomal protein L6
MSRIGKLPVTVPESVKIELVGQEIKVKGKHGELEYAIPDEIKVSMNENAIIV